MTRDGVIRSQAFYKTIRSATDHAEIHSTGCRRKYGVEGRSIEREGGELVAGVIEVTFFEDLVVARSVSKLRVSVSVSLSLSGIFGEGRGGRRGGKRKLEWLVEGGSCINRRVTMTSPVALGQTYLENPDRYQWDKGRRGL